MSTYVRCGTDAGSVLSQIMRHSQGGEQRAVHCDERRGKRVSAQRSYPEPGVLDPGDQHWLEAMADAVLILSPVRDRRRYLIDFRVDYANAAADDLAGDAPDDRIEIGSHLGSHFLGADDAVAGEFVAALREVLLTDVPAAIDGLRYSVLRAGVLTDQVRDVRISRHGDRLLVTLRDVTEREHSEQDVRSSEMSLRALVDGVFDEALMTVDPAGNVVSWNTGAERIFGYSAGQIVGRHYSVLYPRGWPLSVPVASAETIPTDRPHETWQVRRDGRRFWASVSITAMYGENGGLRGFFSVTRDLTEQSEQRRGALHFALVRALVECTDVDAAAETIVTMTTLSLGATFSEMFVARQEEGRLDSTMRHAFPRSTLDALDVAADGAPGPVDALIAHVRTAGSVVIVSDLNELGTQAQVAAAVSLGVRSAIACPIATTSGIVGVLAYFFDTLPSVETLTAESIAEISGEAAQVVTRIRAQGALRAEALHMAELASTDRLTGLKNRREFDRILGTMPRQPFAVLAIDVDHLKHVNDEFGHEAGDTVLRTVATTLALMLRGWDVIARVGGDEFAAILLDVDAAEAASAAQRLRAAMHLVPTPGGRSNISLGWASATAGTDPMSAWRRADECLYEAKRSGRDRVVGRHVDGAEQITPSGSSVTELIGELVNGLPIHAVYQPIVDLNDGHVVGYEALARPEGFGASDSVEALFEVAHRSGHIRDLDWLCRRAALSQAASLPSGILLFMNVSVAALLDPLHDVDQLMLLLEWTGRSPQRLILEIGEHESVRDLDRMRLVLESYRKAGIRFAIDDLGEGFATTELLDTAEPEFVKLARSLTMNAARRSTRVAIKTALGFARAHKSIVIAEGVENELVSDQIRSLNIPLGQGFGLGRPTAAADLLDSAAAWRTRDTLRPLRPRNVQRRVHGKQTGQERDGSAGGGVVGPLQNASRRSLDGKARRIVKRSDARSSGGHRR
jgi:diguanylate cyclase (GGDEF)-like protein/PAS domain S-box-containing protein